jgi:hypothetical protein
MGRRPDVDGRRGVAIRAKVTEEGLLIPKEVADRALGEGSGEVEIFEEPGRLLISLAASAGEAGKEAAGEREDPILSLGEDPVEDAGATDASVNHDRYLYTGG